MQSLKQTTKLVLSLFRKGPLCQFSSWEDM